MAGNTTKTVRARIGVWILTMTRQRILLIHDRTPLEGCPENQMSSAKTQDRPIPITGWVSVTPNIAFPGRNRPLSGRPIQQNLIREYINQVSTRAPYHSTTFYLEGNDHTLMGATHIALLHIPVSVIYGLWGTRSRYTKPCFSTKGFDHHCSTITSLCHIAIS